jgi:hypothetical protein
MSDRRVNVTFEGKVIGWAEVAEDNLVGEIELEPKDMKYIIPGGDLTEGLSIAFKDTALEPDFVRPYIDEDISLTEAYYKNRPKGTFDA